jgi:hypothetical protein
MSGNCDVQQVCENGHQITGCYNIENKERQDFCSKCGAATIIACPNCKKEIQGDPIGEGITGERYPLESADVPLYCHNCGEPYPWTESKIVTAIQIFAEFGDLSKEEKGTIEQDINNIAKDIPQAKLSAMRLKRICEKCGKVAYDVIMELASKTAAEVLKSK